MLNMIIFCFIFNWEIHSTTKRESIHVLHQENVLYHNCFEMTVVNFIKQHEAEFKIWIHPWIEPIPILLESSFNVFWRNKDVQLSDPFLIGDRFLVSLHLIRTPSTSSLRFVRFQLLLLTYTSPFLTPNRSSVLLRNTLFYCYCWPFLFVLFNEHFYRFRTKHHTIRK